MKHTVKLGKRSKIEVEIHEDGSAMGVWKGPKQRQVQMNNFANYGEGSTFAKTFERSQRGLIEAAYWFMSIKDDWVQVQKSRRAAEKAARRARREKRRQEQAKRAKLAGGLSGETGGERLGLLLGSRKG